MVNSIATTFYAIAITVTVMQSHTLSPPPHLALHRRHQKMQCRAIGLLVTT